MIFLIEQWAMRMMLVLHSARCVAESQDVVAMAMNNLCHRLKALAELLEVMDI
jgi:hypothetical protein